MRASPSTGPWRWATGSCWPSSPTASASPATCTTRSSSGCSRSGCSCRRSSADRRVPELGDRLRASVEDLDLTIRDIRAHDLRAADPGRPVAARRPPGPGPGVRRRRWASHRPCAPAVRSTPSYPTYCANSCYPWCARRCPTSPVTPTRPGPRSRSSSTDELLLTVIDDGVGARPRRAPRAACATRATGRACSAGTSSCRRPSRTGWCCAGTPRWSRPAQD